MKKRLWAALATALRLLAGATALPFANAVAAMKCRVLRGRRGIPRLPEVVEFLAAHGHRDLAAALTGC